MKTSTRSRLTNKKNINIITFYVIGLLFHVTMLYHAHFYFYGSDFTLGFAFGFSYYLFHVLQIYNYEEGGFWDYFDDVYNKFTRVYSYHRGCASLYEMRGFPRFLWYLPLFLGPLWMLVSISLFLWMGKSPWSIGISTLGIVVWCVLLQWQVSREINLRARSDSVNRKFVSIKTLQFFLLYMIPLYISYLFGDRWSDRLQTLSFVILTILYSSTILPSWFHICLGQRSPYYRDVSKFLWSDVYGSFGKIYVDYKFSLWKCILWVVLIVSILLFVLDRNYGW